MDWLLICVCLCLLQEYTGWACSHASQLLMAQGPGTCTIMCTAPRTIIIIISCVYIFNRAWSVIHQIYKEEGWRGYFRGLTSTWAREIPGYYCFFFVYEATTRWLAKPREQSVERLGELKYVIAYIPHVRVLQRLTERSDLPQEIEVASVFLVGTWPVAKLAVFLTLCPVNAEIWLVRTT